MVGAGWIADCTGRGVGGGCTIVIGVKVGGGRMACPETFGGSGVGSTLTRLPNGVGVAVGKGDGGVPTTGGRVGKGVVSDPVGNGGTVDKVPGVNCGESAVRVGIGDGVIAEETVVVTVPVGVTAASTSAVSSVPGVSTATA